MEGPIARVMLPIMWFAATRVLTEKTPIGRKMQVEVRQGGGPLLRIKLADLEAAGVEHVDQRVVDVFDGKPVLADGRVLDVANVVWCTGFRTDLSWIDFPVAGDDGWPDAGARRLHDARRACTGSGCRSCSRSRRCSSAVPDATPSRWCDRSPQPRRPPSSCQNVVRLTTGADGLTNSVAWAQVVWRTRCRLRLSRTTTCVQHSSRPACRHVQEPSWQGQALRVRHRRDVS